jgi:acetyl/propionyl-CoA carboxylase alpha subunit
MLIGGRLKRLLIANRGEIARRVIRTARRLGLETVAVYSDADADAPFVREADTAHRIGPPTARESYLDPQRVLAAAVSSGADAVHPGYGFLSENAAFAEAVIAAGMIWVGPPAGAIRAMGLKDAAKRLMAEAGVPVTPGYLGEDQSAGRLKAEADALGYPLLIKAVAGGGGKGMRRVDEGSAFLAALASAQREAASSFGEDRVLLETYVARPRHIEVQIFADRLGGVVHLFERDCTLQRRHQKVIEEAPAPGMDDATRAAVTDAAIRAARAVGYEGAGTVEFIADGSEGLRADRIWFMEMNTRLQVEHPVTEMVTGQDLVEWQLRVAAGEPLPQRQEEIVLRGWAMEGRLYAENPSKGFLPSTGKLSRLRLPPETPFLRVDSGVEEGGVVSQHYDPMIAKIIAHGPTRRAAARTLARAFKAVEIFPVRSNAAFVARCLENPDFLEGGIDTGFIAGRQAALTATPPPGASARRRAAAAVIRSGASLGSPGDADPFSPVGAAAGFRLNAPPDLTVAFAADPDEGLATAEAEDLTAPSLAGVFVDGDLVVVFQDAEVHRFSRPGGVESAAGPAAAGDGRIVSPMPGRIVSVGAQVGAAVAKGQVILVLEAMKMEHALIAPFAGVVAGMGAAVGDQVTEGAVLARVDRAG